MTLSRVFQISLMLLIAIVTASVTYAFAATNTVSAATAGDGFNTVSGYTVSNITYTLNATDPSTLDTVSFTLDASARSVKSKLSAASSTWYTCTNSGGNDWTCNTPGATTASIDQLRILASSH